MCKTAGITTDVRSVYRKLYIDFIGQNSEKVILTHYGELSEDLINNLTEGLEQVLILKGCPPSIIKRMFGVVLNGLSNICLYYEESSNVDNSGHIIVKEENNKYSVSIGNVISKYCQDKVANHLNNLNEMEHSQLGEIYTRNLWNSNGTFQKDLFIGLGSVHYCVSASSLIIKYEAHYFG